MFGLGGESESKKYEINQQLLNTEPEFKNLEISSHTFFPSSQFTQTESNVIMCILKVHTFKNVLKHYNATEG